MELIAFMKKIALPFATLGLLAFALCADAKTVFTVTADRPDCRYDVGEAVTYTVTATDEKGMPHAVDAKLNDAMLRWVCGL